VEVLNKTKMVQLREWCSVYICAVSVLTPKKARVFRYRLIDTLGIDCADIDICIPNQVTKTDDRHSLSIGPLLYMYFEARKQLVPSLSK
jgi:hypothetical protein